MAPVVKNMLANQEMQETMVWSMDWKYLMEEEMATHSSILAWKIPWAEEPGGLQSMGLLRLHITEHTHTEDKKTGSSLDQTLNGLTDFKHVRFCLFSVLSQKSWTRLKWLINNSKLMILWRRKWQPTLVILPGKSHGERILMGYSPWGCKELDTTEQLKNK